jgi:DNA-binding transcriptional LysR family regulator
VSPVSLILKFLRNFFEKHPATKLELRFEVLSGTIERLIDGEVDLAITPKPQIDYPFDYRFLTKTKMIPVISSKLVPAGKKVTDQLLRNYNQIILADSARKLAKVSTGVVEGGKNLTVSDIYIKKELILQGLGWGGLPQDLLKAEVSSKKLIPVKTPLVKERDIDIYIVRDVNKPMGPVMKELWKRLDEEELG